jgi:hypothetical protein
MNNKNITNKNLEIIYIIIAGFVLPLILIPLTKLVGHLYPVLNMSWYGAEIMEEIAKAVVVIFLIIKLPTKKSKIIFGILFGFLFGLSESFFYLNNIFQIGDFSIFWKRLMWTIPMHISTIVIMILASFAGKKWVLLGLLGAIMLHILFNGTLVPLLMF